MRRYVLDTDTCMYWLNGQMSIRINHPEELAGIDGGIEPGWPGW
jgi:hypothetical protein